MKRPFLLLAVAVMLSLGCSTVNHALFPPTPTPTPTSTPTRTQTPTPTDTPTPTPEPQLAGRWDVFVDWEQDGEFASLVWEFLESGKIRFIPNQFNNTGTWSVAGRTVSIEVVSSAGFHAQYTGMLDESQTRIEGTMTNDNGSKGDWHATRQD